VKFLFVKVLFIKVVFLLQVIYRVSVKCVVFDSEARAVDLLPCVFC